MLENSNVPFQMVFSNSINLEIHEIVPQSSHLNINFHQEIVDSPQISAFIPCTFSQSPRPVPHIHFNSLTHSILITVLQIENKWNFARIVLRTECEYIFYASSHALLAFFNLVF